MLTHTYTPEEIEAYNLLITSLGNDFHTLPPHRVLLFADVSEWTRPAINLLLDTVYTHE